jgi:SlyX protein
MSDKQVAALEQRVNDLEIKAAFQEQTIDELNEALSQQQLLISKMQEQMRFMVGKLKSLDSSNLAKESEETPPPHY